MTAVYGLDPNQRRMPDGSSIWYTRASPYWVEPAAGSPPVQPLRSPGMVSRSVAPPPRMPPRQPPKPVRRPTTRLERQLVVAELTGKPYLAASSGSAIGRSWQPGPGNGTWRPALPMGEGNRLRESDLASAPLMAQWRHAYEIERAAGYR